MFAHVDPRLFQRRPFLGVRLAVVYWEALE